MAVLGPGLATRLSLVILLLCASPCLSRKHNLEIRGDSRTFFPISTFGFITGGYLAVNVTGFHVLDIPEEELEADGQGDPAASASTKPQGKVLDPTHLTLGFSIAKTANDALNPYAETSEARCILDPDRKLPVESTKDAILRFNLDFKSNRTKVECSKNIQSINILSNREKLQHILDQHESCGTMCDSKMFQPVVQKSAPPRSKREAAKIDKVGGKGSLDRESTLDDQRPSTTVATTVVEVDEDDSNGCRDVNLRLDRTVNAKGELFFNTSFFLYIANEKEEGLYSLYFHNCHNYDSGGDKVRVSFAIDIEEKNDNSYLSAGEMPLPALYLLMSALFFLSGCFWVFILRKNGSEQVFRIHWIMAALVFLKSLSLFFHGVNYHKIETNGYHIESWAMLYYITHLLKGGLLFFTIVLIGSGWAFVKHILSDRDKKVFIIVLPLQVLANVAYIIIEESEEGDARHVWWREIFILVDLLCCGAILFPVVWSIRHLQDSSQTDGKATVSLEKLKLFRHFYIMVVCYIYFTRIIVYLLKMTVPFRYEWLDETFKEMATFVFFVMTGYKFRPASNNPYFSVPTDEYDMEEVLIGGTAINEQVTNRKGGASSSKRVFVDDDEESDDDEGMVFFPGGKAESSHELD